MRTTTTDNKSATATVKVFREHAEWNKHAKWWMLPAALLNELFVCELRTTVTGADVDEFDAECECVKQAETQYPGHVYVY